MQTFVGKVVIITGASSGVGEATALKFAQEGAKVVVAARREDKGRAVVKKIEDKGGEAIYIKTDVTKRQDVEALVEGALAKFGRLDCAVNNAGISGSAITPLAEIKETSWDEVMNTNLKAVWMCMKYEIPAMIKGSHGAIVNIASSYGSIPSDTGQADYCASKFGLIGLSKTAAVDYAKLGIRVNVVSPSYTKTEMIEPFLEASPEFMKRVIRRHSAMDRLGLPEEIAEAITWLCSDAARFVNGAVLPVNGGEISRLY